VITVGLIRTVIPSASSILDLGCAGGTLALRLDAGFRHYHGVDISDVAIAKAKENLEAARRPHLEHELQVSEIGEFNTSRQFDVIVFNEVLYYLPLEKIPAIIRRFGGMLTKDGVILVSLKEHELCRFIQSILDHELRFEHAVLFQQKPSRPAWKTSRNAETPAYLVQAHRPKTR
jgi:2-polyprenyl-3-methyl-5-hydroxy-6-metoxy-1,4-benzoquinol methylase